MNNKTHKVNVSDLIEWKADAKILFASSSKEQKRLYATANGGFIVTIKDEVVCECTQPIIAVEKYNSIGE